MYLRNVEVSTLLTASQAATAAVTAAYENVDVDLLEIVGDADPLAVAWAAASLASALLATVPPDQARALLASWGGRFAHSAAHHTDVLAGRFAEQPPPDPLKPERHR